MSQQVGFGSRAAARPGRRATWKISSAAMPCSPSHGKPTRTWAGHISGCHTTPPSRAGVGLRASQLSPILVDAVGIEAAGHPVADFFSLTLDQVFTLSFCNPGPFRIDPATLPPAAQAIAAGNRAALATYAGAAMSDPTLAGRLAHLELPTSVLWGRQRPDRRPGLRPRLCRRHPTRPLPAADGHRPPAATRNPRAADERDLEQRRQRLPRLAGPRWLRRGRPVPWLCLVTGWPLLKRPHVAVWVTEI